MRGPGWGADKPRPSRRRMHMPPRQWLWKSSGPHGGWLRIVVLPQTCPLGSRRDRRGHLNELESAALWSAAACRRFHLPRSSTGSQSRSVAKVPWVRSQVTALQKGPGPAVAVQSTFDNRQSEIGYSVHGPRMALCIRLAASGSPTIVSLTGSQVIFRPVRMLMSHR